MNRSKECEISAEIYVAWVGRDKREKGKHRNDADKDITDRKQRGWGGQWVRQQTGKSEEWNSISTRRRWKTCEWDERK